MLTRCGLPQLQHALAMTLEGLAGADDVRGVDRVPLTLDADLKRVDVCLLYTSPSPRDS